MHALKRWIPAGLVAVAATAALAPAASASIGTPTVTLTPTSATAGATANLGTDIKFTPSSGDSTKDLTLELPAGLLANAGLDGGACLKSATPTAACQVGTGTVTATASVAGLPLQMSLSAEFDLVAPPASSDLAGLAVLVQAPGSSTYSQLGSAAAITLRPASDPAGVGLDIEFTSIPNTFDGLSIQVNEINSTFDSLRFPDSCPATPADVIVTADSYLDTTPVTGSAPLTVTGCGSLPFTPGFAVSVTKDTGDSNVAVSTDITQTAGQADARSVSLAFPSGVLSPNLGVVSVLCSNPTTGTCTSIGSAKAVSPLYPAPLVGQAYLTGSFTAPALTIVFGPPFSLSLTGTINLANNSTTFSGIPDFPLSDLGVTLDGGSHAVFETTCHTASGVATASLTAQNGDQSASVATPFTVAGCGSFTGGGKVTAPAASGAKPQLHAVSLTGLADGKPSLLFQLVAGKKAPKISAFTIELPSGVSFIGHRSGKTLRVKGVSLTGAKLKSAVLSHGHLVVTLKGSVTSVILSLGTRGLKESRSLKSKVNRGKLKSLKLKVLVRNAAGKSTTLTVTLRNLKKK
jgi:hypothetical protein